ncbi:MAG: DUF2059 domain-containing protein [bacterium]
MRLGYPVLAALIASSLASPLNAQAIPPADSARPEAIERLFVAADLERLYVQTIEAGTAAQFRANPALAPYADLLRAFTLRYISYDAMKPDLIRLYRETFSESEVEELIRFYQSDFGRWFTTRMAPLGVRSSEMATERIRVHLPELTAEIMARATAPPP